MSSEENSSVARGIHKHETKKLGKRPPARKPTLQVADFFRVEEIPEHPPLDLAPVLAWPMDRNDVAGDCVVAGADHTLQTIAAALNVPRNNWSDAQILNYYQTQNPEFGSWNAGGGAADGGMVIQDFLSYLVHTGEIVAFGAVDHKNAELMRAAAFVGIAVITGEDLRVAQQNQAVWDYKPGSPDWGGHCTTTVGYGPGRQTVISWGEAVEVTDSFVSHQMDEAWMVLTTAMINHPHFRNNFDLAGFAKAVYELTNGNLVIPVPTPAPNPSPTPTPTPPPPVPAPDPMSDFPRDQVAAWLSHKSSHTKVEAATKSAMAKWMATHQL